MEFFWIIITALIVVGVIALVIYDRYYKIKAKEAEQKGKAYKMLEVLNSKYRFKKDDINGRVYERSTNPRKYQDSSFAFSCFVKEVVLPDIVLFESLLETVDYNMRLYPQYEKEFDKLLEYSSNKVEKDLCEQRKMTPILGAKYTIELYYRYYNEYRSKKYEYGTNEIRKAVKEAKKIEMGKIAAQKERAVMSDKLRFLILKRDNYTCQICGKQAKDGVVLEVDHIIPISKGGRTEPSNLQTLCKRCNSGKRDSFMYDDD